MDHFWSALLTGSTGQRVSRRRLENEIRAGILSGQLAPGMRLPSTRHLATDLGVSRGTVVETYAQLVAEGWLVARVGSGTTVTTPGELWGIDPVERLRPQPRAAIDLRFQANDAGGFPLNPWLRATRRAAADPDFTSADHRAPQGSPALREELCSYLGRTRGVRTTPENIIVTTGFIQSLGLISEVLARLGKSKLAVEDPSFPFLRAVATAHGQDVVGVPVDEDGMATELLDTPRLQALPPSGVMLSPARHFPLGANLSPERRLHIVEWAQAHDAYIIEDDYDGEFRFDRRPVGSLQGLDPQRVIYAGTSSKTLGHGLRLGWVAAPPELTPALVWAKQLADGFTGLLPQLALLEMLRDGSFARHVRGRKVTFRQRRDVLRSAIEERVPSVRVRGISAGLNAVLQLPEGVDERAVLYTLADRGVLLSGLARDGYWMQPGPHPASLLLNFAIPSDAHFRRGVEILRETLHDGLQDGRFEAVAVQPEDDRADAPTARYPLY